MLPLEEGPRRGGEALQGAHMHGSGKSLTWKICVCTHIYIQIIFTVYVVSKRGFQWSPVRHLTEMQGWRSFEDPKECFSTNEMTQVSRDAKHKNLFQRKLSLPCCERSWGHVPYPHDKIGLAKANHTLTSLARKKSRSTILSGEGTYRNILWGSINGGASHFLKLDYANKRQTRRRRSLESGEDPESILPKRRPTTWWEQKSIYTRSPPQNQPKQSVCIIYLWYHVLLCHREGPFEHRLNLNWTISQTRLVSRCKAFNGQTVDICSQRSTSKPMNRRKGSYCK